MSFNFYDILEIPETANLDDIKKSYRKLSMLYHPDKNKNNPESTAKFQKISEAYETLGDIDKKQEYDAMQNNPFLKMRAGGNMHNPMEDILANLFGGGIPFGHMGSFNNQQSPFAGESPFGRETPFVRVFHNGVSVNPNMFMQRQKPSPIIKNISFPLVL